MVTFIFILKSLLIVIPVIALLAGFIMFFVKIFKLQKYENLIGISLFMIFGFFVFKGGYQYFPFSLLEDKARNACREEIEDKSKYDYQWTDSWFEGKFSEITKLRQPLTSVNIPISDINFITEAEKEGYSFQEIAQFLNEKRGKQYYLPADIENVVGGNLNKAEYTAPTYTYTGDKIKLQNEFGAFSKYKYDCDYRLGIGVLDVRFTPSVN